MLFAGQRSQASFGEIALRTSYMEAARPRSHAPTPRRVVLRELLPAETYRIYAAGAKSSQALEDFVRSPAVYLPAVQRKILSTKHDPGSKSEPLLGLVGSSGGSYPIPECGLTCGSLGAGRLGADRWMLKTSPIRTVGAPGFEPGIIFC